MVLLVILEQQRLLTKHKTVRRWSQELLELYSLVNLVQLEN